MLHSIYALIFLFGLIIGSFLNCLIYRLEKNKSFLKGRSYCPHCNKTLKWFDLIPILSFLFLRAKCRYCKKKISFQYPLVELVTGLLFVLIFWHFGFNVGFVALSYFLISTVFLIIIFVYDLKHYIIPDKIIYPAIVIAIIFNLQFLVFNQFSIFKFSILSAVLPALFFLAIILLSRGRAMGWGDFKLAILMGLLLGWPNILVAFFLAFLMGSLVGMGLIISKRKTIKSIIPFGPFLVIATFIALFFGEQIITWYLLFFSL